MTTLMPEGEAIRKAVKWVSEKRRQEPNIKIYKLVDEAGIRFNLSPKEEEFLMRFCKEETC